MSTLEEAAKAFKDAIALLTRVPAPERAITAEQLIAMSHFKRPKYEWLIGLDSMDQIRTIHDGDGVYLMTPCRTTLLGYPVVITDGVGVIFREVPDHE